MPFGYFFGALIIDLLLAFLIAEYLGSKRNIGFGWSFFVSLFFGPLLGLLITLLSRPRTV